MNYNNHSEQFILLEIRNYGLIIVGTRRRFIGIVIDCHIVRRAYSTQCWSSHDHIDILYVRLYLRCVLIINLNFDEFHFEHSRR